MVTDRYICHCLPCNNTWEQAGAVNQIASLDNMTLAELENLRLTAVPLLNAAFCVDCETISNSPHDACMVCGSHSLISLIRVFGGTLQSQKSHSTEAHKPHSTEAHAKTAARYNLEVTASVHDIPAIELNQAIELITRLAEVGGNVKCLHINIESVFDTQALLKAA
jgi:hypothetical protein